MFADTTYKTNKFNFPFFTIATVDKYGLTLPIYGSFLAKEDF